MNKKTNKSKTSTRTKMRYNRRTYTRYEFNVRIDGKLNAIIERYKQNPENSLSELIKSCLCKHFKIDRSEADDIYVDYRIDKNGEHISNNELDKYF